MEVGQVWILDVQVRILQVVSELHGGVGGVVTFGTVVHLHALVFPRVEDVLADILSTVGSEGDKQIKYSFFGKHFKTAKIHEGDKHLAKFPTQVLCQQDFGLFRLRCLGAAVFIYSTGFGVGGTVVYCGYSDDVTAVCRLMMLPERLYLKLQATNTDMDRLTHNASCKESHTQEHTAPR